MSAPSGCGAGFDTALEVLLPPCGSLTVVDCNDDSCGLQAELLLSGQVPGTTYFIRVEYYSSSGTSTAFPYLMDIELS